MPELTITVYLSPNEQYTGDPDPTWPRPAGVTLQLKQAKEPGKQAKEPGKQAKEPGKQAKEPGKQAKELGPTDSEGVITLADIAQGTYLVEVLDPYFADWTPADPISIDEDVEAKNVILTPPEDTWLLPLLLRRYGDDGEPAGIPGAEVKDQAGTAFRSRDDGFVYAAVPRDREHSATLSFEDASPPGLGPLKPQNTEIKFRIYDIPQVETTEVAYLADDEAPGSPLTRISIEPTVHTVLGEEALTGTRATIEYSAHSSPRTLSAPALAPGEKKIWFNNLLPGIYAATVTPPPTFNDWPIVPGARSFMPERALAGRTLEHEASFKFQKVTVTGSIQAMDGRLVEQEVRVEIYGSENYKILTVKGGTFEVQLDWGVPLKIRLALDADISLDGLPLQLVSTEWPLSLTSPNVLVLPFKYGVKGQAVDESGKPFAGALIDVFDEQQNLIGSVASAADGSFIAGTAGSGSFYVAAHMTGGEPATRQLVPVKSIGDAGPVVIPSRRTVVAERLGPQPGGGAGGGALDGRGPDGHDRAPEALTDLAAYPVLTEEISTTGVAAPVTGGTGGGIAGAGYGQAVDQVMRDVLGWRPGGDAAGFQAALAGAFQLREVEGHTEWTWQQRGYAVQADMGALTGAQASIYARASAAVDQVQPLLAGLTALNPALYPPQDLETIRTIVAAELTELVSELGLDGGPRIQRVDQLFDQLLGASANPPDMDPDEVGGQLGTLRDRFGLTVDEVKTLDEERILTNFRVVVDQVLALNASWRTDRDLFSRDVFSGKASQTSFGTTLIWLSRSLEAVIESVDDLNFALNSVFVDAAQRQVIELRFRENQEPPMILSDLLDWVVRTCRDEGPRMIQDAGKDGVVAVSRVLQKLRRLVRETIQLSNSDRALPAGLRTPRVTRAFQVLAKQLQEATNLATSVRRDEAPEITAAWVQDASQPGQVVIHLLGSNFQTGASAVFRPQNWAGLGPQRAQPTEVVQPNLAVALFTGDWTSWEVTGLISLSNEDGTQSNEVQISLVN
jgi:hypothetical protein